MSHTQTETPTDRCWCDARLMAMMLLVVLLLIIAAWRCGASMREVDSDAGWWWRNARYTRSRAVTLVRGLDTICWQG